MFGSGVSDGGSTAGMTNNHLVNINDVHNHNSSFRPGTVKSPANSACSDIRFKPYEIGKSTAHVNKKKASDLKSTGSRTSSPASNIEMNGQAASGQNYR